MYRRILISLVVFALFVLFPARVTGEDKIVEVSFQYVKHIEFWQPTGKKWYKCQIIDWNLMGSPHPELTIAIPPRQIFTPLRIYLRLTWREAGKIPPFSLGIDGHTNRPCEFRPKGGDKILVKLLVRGHKE